MAVDHQFQCLNILSFVMLNDCFDVQTNYFSCGGFKCEDRP
jgi:hypothetical protein